MNTDIDSLFLLNVSCVFNSPANRRPGENENIEIDETPQEKKLRLAKLYLDQLRDEGVY